MPECDKRHLAQTILQFHESFGSRSTLRGVLNYIEKVLDSTLQQAISLHSLALRMHCLHLGSLEFIICSLAMQVRQVKKSPCADSLVSNLASTEQPFVDAAARFVLAASPVFTSVKCYSNTLVEREEESKERKKIEFSLLNLQCLALVRLHVPHAPFAHVCMLLSSPHRSCIVNNWPKTLKSFIRLSTTPSTPPSKRLSCTPRPGRTRASQSFHVRCEAS